MLILVRHGQTSINAGGRLQGRIDPELDETGRAQAIRLGAHIRATWPGARVVSSPLMRARQTASAITDVFDVDESFVELDYGAWDGLMMSEVPPDQWSRWRGDPMFTPPGGESLHELDLRVRPALEALCEEAHEGDVVVVTHVSPIKSAITWALGIGPDATWRCHLDRASITRISVGPARRVLASMNETGHLN